MLLFLSPSLSTAVAFCIAEEGTKDSLRVAFNVDDDDALAKEKAKGGRKKGGKCAKCVSDYIAVLCEADKTGSEWICNEIRHHVSCN